jgi:hypothetical protein
VSAVSHKCPNFPRLCDGAYLVAQALAGDDSDFVTYPLVRFEVFSHVSNGTVWRDSGMIYQVSGAGSSAR